MEPQADWLDAASEHEQEMRDDAIAEIRRKVTAQEDRYHAHCLWCGDESFGQEFCCSECRDDADRVEAHLARTGGRV